MAELTPMGAIGVLKSMKDNCEKTPHGYKDPLREEKAQALQIAIDSLNFLATPELPRWDPIMNRLEDLLETLEADLVSINIATKDNKAITITVQRTEGEKNE